jgi:epoxide hydrolase-like predicted phosphatase
MPIKAVIWDIGGVIARTEDLKPRDQLAKDLGITRADINDLFFSGSEGVRAQKGEITVEELITSVREKLKLTPLEHPDLITRFFAGDRVDNKLVDFIRSLKPRYKTAIISNAWSGLVEMLNDWGIQDAFDAVIGSGDVGILKPDPKIYQLALDRLGVAADEAVFVDDFIENVNGALRLGMRAIQFKSPGQVIGDLKQLLELP